MKTIRNIIYLILIYIILTIIYPILQETLLGLVSMSKFWSFVLLIPFGGFAVVCFYLFVFSIIGLREIVMPNEKYAFTSFLVLSVIKGIENIIDYWTRQELYENGSLISSAMILTLLTIGFVSASFNAAGTETINSFDGREAFANVFYGIGKLFFILGMFLIFILILIN